MVVGGGGWWWWWWWWWVVGGVGGGGGWRWWWWFDMLQPAPQYTREKRPTHHTHYTLLCDINACLKKEKYDRRHSLLL